MYLLYFLLWVIFNGAVTVEICLFGIVVAAAVFAFTCRFMDYSLEKEKKLYKTTGKFLKYVYVLVFEIVKANMTVIHMILSEKEELAPAVFDFEADMKTPAGKVMLANAITLTPGTITVELEDNHYTVHCLDESLAPQSDDSVFVQMISDMER
ncbi:MAG: Na+/H+ antiporter subunit E [Clostridiales bacterium]|nr:Na+/H+ antiporter subunit E [Candidatus Blautia equi]